MCGVVTPQPFTCHYCHKYFCGDHRIPEVHHCIVSRKVMIVPSQSETERGTPGAGLRKSAEPAEKWYPRTQRPVFPRRVRRRVVKVVGVLMVLALVGAVAYATYPQWEGLAASIASQIQPQAIDSRWAQEFFGNLSAAREANGAGALTMSQQLDDFASLRFSDLVTHYEITHYGYQRDFSNYFGVYSGLAATEEYFYPSGHSPSGYLSYIKQDAIIHYEGLVDGTYSRYGFYIGTGPVYNLIGSCSVAEIVGSVNQTQFFEQHGCDFSIGQTTWLVVELTS